MSSTTNCNTITTLKFSEETDCTQCIYFDDLYDIEKDGMYFFVCWYNEEFEDQKQIIGGGILIPVNNKQVSKCFNFK